jgi:hypothetical protein
MTLSVGDHNRKAYVVIALGDNDLYTTDFEDKEEALNYVKEIENKCYIICVEYDGGGVYKIISEPHT